MINFIAVVLQKLPGAHYTRIQPENVKIPLAIENMPMIGHFIRGQIRNDGTFNTDDEFVDYDFEVIRITHVSSRGGKAGGVSLEITLECDDTYAKSQRRWG